ncbi:hypothetical protein WR25_05941 [Diploscapter pachys]|uniref:Uncharacterized protein n=1 Tax=Diploscapter pachys TaxID=2018661 RepID=A0A2A2L6Y5_9BILA|nr:hypothetical protein WR25_05941 [Diploscapter pachys]
MHAATRAGSVLFAPPPCAKGTATVKFFTMDYIEKKFLNEAITAAAATAAAADFRTIMAAATADFRTITITVAVAAADLRTITVGTIITIMAAAADLRTYTITGTTTTEVGTIITIMTTVVGLLTYTIIGIITTSKVTKNDEEDKKRKQNGELKTQKVVDETGKAVHEQPVLPSYEEALKDIEEVERL